MDEIRQTEMQEEGSGQDGLTYVAFDTPQEAKNYVAKLRRRGKVAKQLYKTVITYKDL